MIVLLTPNGADESNGTVYHAAAEEGRTDWSERKISLDGVIAGPLSF